MKLVFQGVKQDIVFLMRRAGYGFGRVEAGEYSFLKRLGANRYPRFHAYAQKEGDNLAVNLHLDQKQPSYEGATAHSGEYSGELIEQESERIKLAINKAMRETNETAKIFNHNKSSFLKNLLMKFFQ